MTKTVPETNAKEILVRFNELKKHHPVVARRSVRERKKILRNFLKSIFKNEAKIKEALYLDMKKPGREIDMTEIYPTVSEIRNVLRNLNRWAAPEQVNTPLALFGSKSFVHREPKGVVLIISPWNFPVNLTFGPLVTAIAAGNSVIIKPSEHTPHISKAMREIVETTFPDNEVVLIEGGVESAQTLLSLPFNHIFFTGSPQIGKIVMQAAAKQLASVTLELGGKSPTIIDKTANLKKAAERIALAKFTNNGQICIAPDHIYIHHSVVKSFVEHMMGSIRKMYGTDLRGSSSLGRIVNEKQFDRLENYLTDSTSNNREMDGGSSERSDLFIEPTMVHNPLEDSGVMKEEIFGPILPILTYENIDEAIEKINKREKPLALYIFSNSKKNTSYIINKTRAGGTCINHAAIHFYNHNLPFGGVNNSGIGKAGGKYGFDSFSNRRAILKQWLPISSLELIRPPYGSRLKDFLIRFTLKYL